MIDSVARRLILSKSSSLAVQIQLLPVAVHPQLQAGLYKDKCFFNISTSSIFIESHSAGRGFPNISMTEFGNTHGGCGTLRWATNVVNFLFGRGKYCWKTDKSHSTHSWGVGDGVEMSTLYAHICISWRDRITDEEVTRRAGMGSP